MKVSSTVFYLLLVMFAAIPFLTTNCEFLLGLFSGCRTETVDYRFRNYSSYNIEVTYSDVECVLVEGEDGEEEYVKERTYTTFDLYIGQSRSVSAQVLAGKKLGFSTDSYGFVKSSTYYDEESEIYTVIFRDPD